MGAVFFKAVARPDLEYSKKQILILAEAIPLEEVRKNELTAIIKKARARGDQDILEYAEELLGIKELPPSILPMYTIEEAKEILQSLTPWIIQWDPPDLF